VIRFDPASTELVVAVPMLLDCESQELADGGPAAVRLTVSPPSGREANPIDLDAVVFGSWDWSRDEPALSFSGIDGHGVVWSGTKGE
jgi:arabinan endo-1,5-alpha-L-arabinosidase